MSNEFIIKLIKKNCEKAAKKGRGKLKINIGIEFRAEAYKDLVAIKNWEKKIVPNFKIRKVKIREELFDNYGIYLTNTIKYKL